jgi:hypothetical protein
MMTLESLISPCILVEEMVTNLLVTLSTWHLGLKTASDPDPEEVDPW